MYNYLELFADKRKNLALAETQGDNLLSMGLKLRVLNFLNSSNIIIDGRWTAAKRSAVEITAIKKLCADDISFDDFVVKYNDMLRYEGIPFDENIYITDDVISSRKNHLSLSRFILWKQNEMMRYYDIDGQDYSELFDVLNLDSYDNIELSTAKFIDDYPEVMKKYDIRDQYELHNLLRKIASEKDYPKLRFGRMPIIKFGEFDRAAAAREMIINCGRLTMEELVEKMHSEYGYDQGSVPFKEIDDYYYQGVYSVPDKRMSDENMTILKNALTDDFYYISEIRDMYAELVSNADTDEINPFNLKTMGFNVYPKYALQNYSSLDSYFDDLLTKDDVTDISAYRRRFACNPSFSAKLMALKRNLTIVEFEPEQIICFRRLEQNGMTKDMIKKFCEDVFDFTEDDRYFSIQSIRRAGFEADIFDCGFDNWFYSNLLISDGRFSYMKTFGNYIFYKGEADISTKSFERHLVGESRIIDLYDLMNELTEVYGCRINEKLDIIYKLYDTDVYYDKILDRFYANKELYYREIEGAQR